MQNEPKIINLSRGTKIGHYELREVLDTDSFCITYNAWDTKRYRLLTIKEYFPGEIANRDNNSCKVNSFDNCKSEYQEGLDQFLNVAKTLATFSHPNIIKVLDYYQLNNTAYLCISREQNQTLDKLLIQQDSTLPEQELEPIFIALLSALKYIHERNFYHNNITLNNIGIRTQGEPVLINFKNTHQASSTNKNEHDSWYDLYTLGSSLYQCICGKEPIDIQSRKKAIAKDNIDPLTSATEAASDHYTEKFLGLIDWMLRPERIDGPQNAEMILTNFENGVLISNTNNLQPDISKQEKEKDDDNNHFKNNLIPNSNTLSNNEQAIQTDFSKEITTTPPTIISKPRTSSRSFSTIVWLVPTSIIVFVLILIGLSLKQPLQQTMSSKNETGHKNIKPETLGLKPILKNQINKKSEKLSLEKNIAKKQEVSPKPQLETIIQKNPNKEIAKMNKPNNISLAAQEVASEQGHKTLPQNQIKEKLIDQTLTSAAQQISSLLATASIDIKHLRLSTPLGNNAYEKYQKILQLTPNNISALQGLSIITEKYLQFVRKNQQQHNYGRAKHYLNKAKMIQPNNPAIIEAENNLITTESTQQQSQPNLLKNSKRPLEIKMIWIGPSCFQMGDNEIYATEHEVCLTRGYYLGKYEVTQSQWHQVMNNTPSVSKGSNNPIENVSWNQVQTFIRKLNDLTGKHYRLPTEAEWEYACRNGGKKIKYCGSNNANRVAWYKENADSKIHPVGQKQPNLLGLYDMSGNVWEWVQDWYKTDYYSNSPIDNPKGPFEGTGHVVRGGSWFSGKNILRSAYRVWYGPNIHVSYLGFRLAR